MKIDPNYLKGLLEAFESAPEPVTDVSRLQKAGINYEDDQFLFHMGILEDQGLMEREDGKPGFGYVRGADGISGCWSVVPLRLTAQGNNFLEALRNKEVWATIKKNFKEGSIGTLIDVSKKLLESYTEKKIKEVLDGSN